MYNDGRQTTFILDQAVAAAPHRAPEPSWRLEGAAALFEVLDVEDQPIGHIDWAVTEQPQLVTNLIQFAMRSPQLDGPQVAADAVPAADLVREAPLRGLMFLLQPADPRRAVEPKLPIPSEAELPWLRECIRSPSDWLALCGVILISNITGLDGNKLLLDDLSVVNVNLRKRVPRPSSFRTGTPTSYRRSGSRDPDQLVKAAAARVLGGRPLDPLQIDALVSDADLTIRFAASCAASRCSTATPSNAPPRLCSRRHPRSGPAPTAADRNRWTSSTAVHVAAAVDRGWPRRSRTFARSERRRQPRRILFPLSQGSQRLPALEDACMKRPIMNLADKRTSQPSAILSRIVYGALPHISAGRGHAYCRVSNAVRAARFGTSDRLGVASDGYALPPRVTIVVGRGWADDAMADRNRSKSDDPGIHTAS